MNRKESEKPADKYGKHAMRISDKLQEVLLNDLGETLLQNVQAGKVELTKEAVHGIHNMSLFYLLLKINGFYTYDFTSKTVKEQYIKFAETIQGKFLDIVEELNSFQPESSKFNDNQNSKEI